ncbi:site-specific integrase [Telluribacter sp. SYSU D00476]|uniref:tyrosine-type recombinase/integrase n=1 Tax=Telluribacter sp. SYSU D00476 TaxID=2811430 RepID=UPI001FF4E88C|nr:site-specific integrase [Telluribacter sp. SYSU D00476]
MVGGSFKFILRDRPNEDGTHTVRLRYAYNQKDYKRNTNVRVKPREFYPKGTLSKANWIRPSNSNYAIHNATLKAIFESALKAYNKLLELEIEPTVENVKNALKGSLDALEPEEVQEGCYLEYFQNAIELMRQEPQHRRTAMNYEAIYNKFKEFVGKDRLPFSQLTPKLIRDYELWELQRNGRTTVSKSLQRMNKIFKDAAKEELPGTEKNPFRNIKLSFESREKEKLELEDFYKLGELELDPGKKEYHVRNLFMFLFYAHGMRIGDALTLKGQDIRESNGIYTIYYKMEKTNNRVEVEIPFPALSFIGEYLQSKKYNKFLFPFLNNSLDFSDHCFRSRQIEAKTAYINKVLKQLAKKAGLIKGYNDAGEPEFKNLSCHVARHSFADLARRKGIDLYVISKALRHSSVKITEQYLSSFDAKAVNSINHIYEDGPKKA